MKNVISKINYCKVSEILNGNIDPAFTLDGIDFINIDPEIVINKMEDAGFIENGNIIIPKGATLLNKNNFGGTTSYEFEFNNHNLILDILIDVEEKYIS